MNEDSRNIMVLIPCKLLLLQLVKTSTTNRKPIFLMYLLIVSGFSDDIWSLLYFSGSLYTVNVSDKSILYMNIVRRLSIRWLVHDEQRVRSHILTHYIEGGMDNHCPYRGDFSRAEHKHKLQTIY